jgi:hypothetical protein
LFASLALLGQSPEASRLALPDQLGEAQSVAALQGDEAVVIVVTARRLRTAKPWQQALHERYEDLRTVLVADVPSDPEPLLDRDGVLVESVAGRWKPELGSELFAAIDALRGGS